MTRSSFDDLSFLDELFVVGAAFDELESALLLDDFGCGADIIAAPADSSHQARALHAAGEFPNGRKRAFVAAFGYFCVYRHESRVYHTIPLFGNGLRTLWATTVPLVPLEYLILLSVNPRLFGEHQP